MYDVDVQQVNKNLIDLKIKQTCLYLIWSHTEVLFKVISDRLNSLRLSDKLYVNNAVIKLRIKFVTCLVLKQFSETMLAHC